METLLPITPEPDTAMEKETQAVIVSGFPGVGKTTFIDNPGELTLMDSDSSNFSWSNKEAGQRHPDWPQNYINHIRESSSKADIILVSTHKEVRDALVSAGIEFVLVYPSLEMKEEYIRRYLDRGSDGKFIRLLEANYETWIEELMAQPICRHVVLQPGQYLSDVMGGIGSAE